MLLLEKGSIRWRMTGVMVVWGEGSTSVMGVIVFFKFYVFINIFGVGIAMLISRKK